MTQKAALLLPVVGTIFLTFGMMLYMLKLRYRAVLKDGLDVKYFKLFKGANVPEYLQKVTQNYQNLLEMPPLFYLAVLLLLTLNLSDVVYVGLAWAYFLSRLIHSYIHTTHNRLFLRKNAFIGSMLILIAMWLRIAIDVVSL